MEPAKRLYRSKKDRIIFGVCGGLGEYFDVDPLIFRILFVLISFGGGAGVIIYIILALIVPADPVGNGPVTANASGSVDQSREKINQFAQELRQGAQNFVNEVRTNPQPGRRRGHYLFGLIVVLIGAI